MAGMMRRRVVVVGVLDKWEMRGLELDVMRLVGLGV